MKELPCLSLGLIGYPLDNSLSPVLHNAALISSGISGKYELYPIQNSTSKKKELRRIIDAMHSGMINGLNVTKPYKQDILEFVDAYSPAVEMIGAANVLNIHNGQIIAENTDAAGFMTDLQNLYSRSGLIPENEQRTLVLGAGGAARAVVYSLLNFEWPIFVASRKPTQARELGTTFSSNKLSAIPYTVDGILSIGPVDLIVNATPVGMYPMSNETPWLSELNFPAHSVVYDMVYNPVNTLLVQSAKYSGLTAIGGIGMLIEQAALSFEIWTGKKAPRDDMRRAVSYYISGSITGK